MQEFYYHSTCKKKQRWKKCYTEKSLWKMCDKPRILSLRHLDYAHVCSPKTTKFLMLLQHSTADGKPLYHENW